MTDNKCTVSKQFLSHPACKGVPQVFVANSNGTWDPHPLNMDTQALGVAGSNYSVLINGERAPFVAMHKATTATQFSFARDYPESLRLFKNWLGLTIGAQSKGIPLAASLDFYQDKLH
jgi:hypothetical protein